MNDYIRTLTTEELQKRHYQQPAMQAKVTAELIRRGVIVKKTETPIMRMLAAQLELTRKSLGAR